MDKRTKDSVAVMALGSAMLAFCLSLLLTF